MLAVGVAELSGIASASVHSRSNNFKVLKIDTLSISTKVVDLEAFWDIAAFVFVMPSVRVDLLPVLVLECPVPRWVEGASPFKAA